MERSRLEGIIRFCSIIKIVIKKIEDGKGTIRLKGLKITIGKKVNKNKDVMKKIRSKEIISILTLMMIKIINNLDKNHIKSSQEIIKQRIATNKNNNKKSS